MSFYPFRLFFRLRRSCWRAGVFRWIKPLSLAPFHRSSDSINSFWFSLNLKLSQKRRRPPHRYSIFIAVFWSNICIINKYKFSLQLSRTHKVCESEKQFAAAEKLPPFAVVCRSLKSFFLPINFSSLALFSRRRRVIEFLCLKDDDGGFGRERAWSEMKFNEMKKFLIELISKG